MKLTTKQLKQLIKEELASVYEAMGDDLSDEQRVTLLKDPMDLQKLEGAVSSQPSESHKPHGLWYSLGDQWIQFAKSEMKDKFEGHEWLYDLQVKTTNLDSPNPAAVLILDTREDALRLFKRHGIEQITRYSSTKIKWAWLARHYGGIEVRDMALHLFYGWDIDSGCVWNKEAITNIETLNQPADYSKKESIPEKVLEDLEEVLEWTDEDWKIEEKLECVKSQDARCFGEVDPKDMKTVWNWVSQALNDRPEVSAYDLKDYFDFKDPYYNSDDPRVNLFILLHLMTRGIDGLSVAVEIEGVDKPYETASEISKTFNKVMERYGINKEFDISSDKSFEDELQAQAAMNNEW